MQLQFDWDRMNVYWYLINMIQKNRQPSGMELLQEVEKKFGWQVRWDICDIIQDILDGDDITRFEKEYFFDLFNQENENYIFNEQNKSEVDNNNFKSTLDFLLEEGQKYRKSDSFIEMIQFMGRFRRYSPYNNMLVKIQNPHCSFYATKNDWLKNFRRTIKEDAKPMLILAPMHPVMLVYDLDSTEGKDLPKELLEFAKFQGDWNSQWLTNLEENTHKYEIRITYKQHSSTSAGFATIDSRSKVGKMRISIHDRLDEPSRFGVLCHELAHILLGHLGADKDRWWPSRRNLSHTSVEVEAEAVAYLVTQRLGLQGSSIAYLASYLKEEKLPDGISLDFIAKIAGKIEEMAKGKVPKPKKKKK